MVDIQAGDHVQARLKGTDGVREEYLVTEFDVASIDAAGVMHGSLTVPAGLDPAQGWSFELISRPDLVLPDVPTQILASVETDAEPVSLVGMGAIWVRSDTGALVKPDDIRHFTPADQVAIPIALPPIPATQVGQ